MTKKLLAPMIMMLLTATASSSNVAAAPAEPEYNPFPPTPTCSLALTCPPTYGALDMTVTCGELTNFYVSDEFDGALYTYQLDAYSMTRWSETYQYDYILACTPGWDPATWPQACVSYHTYYPESTWCGKKPPNQCPTNETYCGPVEGCRSRC